MSGPTIFVRFSNVLAAILFLPFEIRTGHFLTSLDRFGMNKILFMTLLCIKQSSLVDRTRCPVFGRFDIRMPGTGIRFNPNTDGGSVFGCLLYIVYVPLTRKSCLIYCRDVSPVFGSKGSFYSLIYSEHSNTVLEKSGFLMVRALNDLVLEC